MSTKVEIVKGTAFELQPGKKYLIIFDKRHVSAKTISNLRMDGIDATVLLLDGNPKDVQIIEDNRKATEEKK